MAAIPNTGLKYTTDTITSWYNIRHKFASNFAQRSFLSDSTISHLMKDSTVLYFESILKMDDPIMMATMKPANM